MVVAITADMVERTMALHSERWLGPWQRRNVEAVCGHPEVVLKAMRQTGKTRGAVRTLETALLLGYRVVVGAPKLEQTKGLLTRPILEGMRKTAPLFGIEVVSREALDREWSNGARLKTLSMSPEAQKEGYPADWLWIDEAHRVSRDQFSVVLPMITQAKLSGHARITLSGIGATTDALTEQAYSQMGFFLRHCTPEEVIADDPRYEQVVADFRRQMTAREFAEHMECANLGEGMHQAYPIIPEVVEVPREARNVRRRLVFGIDVGWVKDETVIVVMESVPGWDVHNVLACEVVQGGAFHEQAERVFTFIDQFAWDPRNIGVEWNGGGAGLYYALAQLMPGIQRVAITNKVKFGAVTQIQRALEHGRLGIADARARAELSALQIDYKGVDEDRWEITHSDVHSALLVAVAIGGL